ncbi:MAG: hypothetical protein GY847_41535 [Proteobacteria bacterium]|nr:hypothetical protein [Pseudomonadota bacterium]
MILKRAPSPGSPRPQARPRLAQALIGSPLIQKASVCLIQPLRPDVVPPSSLIFSFEAGIAEKFDAYYNDDLVSVHECTVGSGYNAVYVTTIQVKFNN